MLKRDFIMRMVEQLGNALIHIMKLKQEEQLAEAQQEVNATSRQLLGVNFAILEALDVDQITRLLNCDGDILAARAFVLGELFSASAEIAAAQDDPGFADAQRHKALHFYLLAWEKSSQFRSQDIQNKIHALIDTVRTCQPDSTGYLLFCFMENSGDLPRAEDLLFQLAEAGYPNIRQIGENFFAELFRKADHELESAGLPRTELEEDLLSFRKITGQRPDS